MAERIFSRADQLLISCFSLHDFASALLSRHLFGIKRALLIVAHLSLFGFLFPDMRKEFGEIAMNLLIVILFLSPLAKIFQMRLLIQLVGIRRELGILMAYLATVHGIGYLLDPEWFSVFIGPYVWMDFFAIEPRLILGLGAYLLTLPLLLTSNTLALRFLGGKKWKFLHRSVYGVFFVAIFHRLFTQSANGYDVGAFIQAVILISAYLFVKLLAWKNCITPFRNAIASVGERYAEYVLMKKIGIASQPHN